VQARDPSRPDTFWTWRERMYALANRVTLDDLERLARLAYTECLEAGYTAVGEFHYLHHASPGADPWVTSRVTLAAARQAGIRIALLWTVYARGGFDTPLAEAQGRFRSASLDQVRRALDALMTEVDGRHSVLGLAIHSVRAVPRVWLGPLAEEAAARGLVLHAHVAEQAAEVAACRAATGLTPMGLLAAEGVLGPRFSAVHATWVDDDDLALLARSGATVVVCPTTEGDLGDGVPRTAELFAAGVPIAIGSDSHAVIDPWSELRLLDLLARARAQARCVLSDAEGRVAPVLQQIGSDHGYAALGLDATGDEVLLRPDALALEASDDPRAAALTAGHPGLVDRVRVAGVELVAGGRHVNRMA
jgi:formiminoglutamate deiminase